MNEELPMTALFREYQKKLAMTDENMNENEIEAQKIYSLINDITEMMQHVNL